MIGDYKVNVNNAWKEGCLPVINGIIYSNGCIEKMGILQVGDVKKVGTIKKMHINELKKDVVSFIVVNDTYDDMANRLRIYCGEGSYGGDGFVAVESLDKEQIVWVAFFEDSNPFDKIILEENKLNVINNLKENWQFNLNKPNEINITI